MNIQFPSGYKFFTALVTKDVALVLVIGKFFKKIVSKPAIK